MGNLYLVHWKPQSGLPVTQGQFGTAGDAVAHMQALVTARTETGRWAVVAASQPHDAEPRDVLLRSADGDVETYFISEHHGAVVTAAAHPSRGPRTQPTPTVQAARATPPTHMGEPADLQWNRRYRLREV